MTPILPPTALPRTKPAFLQFDTIDDKREIIFLLNRMTPARRLLFFEICCAKSYMCSPKDGLCPKPDDSVIDLADRARWDSSASQMLTQEIYRDLWYLSAQYQLDLDEALAVLVAMVRER